MEDPNIKLDPNTIPGNSIKERTEKREQKQKVIQGHVRKSKPTIGKRITGKLFEEDGRSVGSYLLEEILLPAFKNLFVDLVTGGVETLCYGQSSRKSSSRDRKGDGYTPYGSVYKSSGFGYSRNEPRNRNSRTNIDNIVLETRQDAEAVLDQLCDTIQDYGIASVADLNEAIGEPGNFTDNNWGWETLRSASIRRVRDGWLLELPRPIALNR